MVPLALQIFLTAFSLMACIFAALACAFSIYNFIRIRAWEQTETKVLQVPNDSNGFDELNKQMESMKKNMSMDLSDVGFDMDDQV